MPNLGQPEMLPRIGFVHSTFRQEISEHLTNSKPEKAPSKFNNFPVNGHHLSPLLSTTAASAPNNLQMDMKQ